MTKEGLILMTALLLAATGAWADRSVLIAQGKVYMEKSVPHAHDQRWEGGRPACSWSRSELWGLNATHSG